MDNLSNPSTHSITFGREVIEFKLQYSNRKTLGIDVHPDLSVVVTAPRGKGIDSVKEKVHKRAAWILKQKEFFKDFLPMMPPRQYISGESHYYLGKQYRLKVIESHQEQAKMQGRYINVYVKNRDDRNRVEELFKAWLLSHARTRFEYYLQKCWEKTRQYKVTLPQLQIRKMRKRWGSCSSRGFIYLNPDLIKAPSHCIEYVITHELCHLKHPNHSKGFYQMLRKVMPDWERRKLRLEKVDIGT